MNRRIPFRIVRIPLPPAIVAGLALAALLSGCSSEVDGTASEATSSTGGAASSSAADAEPPAADALQAAVLQPSDLPAGWTAQPADGNDENDAAGTKALLACVGGRDTSPDEVDEAEADFATADGSTVSSSATSYRSQQDVDDDVAIFTDPAASGCFAQAFGSLGDTSDLPPGTTVGTPQLTITPGNGGGPANVVATGTGSIPVTVSGMQITFYVDVAFITGRQTEASVGFFGIGAPVPSELQSSLVETVAGRVGAL